MAEFTYSRFAYFDTNILSYLAKHRGLWPRLFRFLWDNDLTLCFSGGHAAELSQATRLHPALAELLIQIPSGLVKPKDEIVQEEVQAHPLYRTESLLLQTLNILLGEVDGLQQIEALLTSPALSEARKKQIRDAQQMAVRHALLKNNFPPSKMGLYTRQQADEFAWTLVIQWLAHAHRPFLEKVSTQITNLQPEVFLSIRMFAYVIFYKYYLGRRHPRRLSDFGDLEHLFLLPYCDLIVMERDLSNVLSQIKRNHDILNATVIRTIDFLTDWTWQE